MDFDFKPYFVKYEAFVGMVEKIFEQVKAEYPASINCKKGCSDCCHAVFDLTLIEAVYLNHKFQAQFGQDKDLLERANKADRQVYKLKKRAYQEHQDGKNEVAILQEMGMQRIRCALLNERDLCDLYEFRPITCRLYGIPTAIQGMGHTCGKSAFDEGETYPTVNMDRIYSYLYELSAELVTDIKTKYVKMGEMLVPVSMALITDYDDVFFGFAKAEDEAEDQNGKK